MKKRNEDKELIHIASTTLKEYLVWTATLENIQLDGEVCSPLRFANKADEEFRKR